MSLFFKSAPIQRQNNRVNLLVMGSFFLIVLAGCASNSPVKLDSKYIKSTSHQKMNNDHSLDSEDDMVNPCPKILITKIEDARLDKSNLGKVGSRDVASTDIEKWLENALTTHGYEINLSSDLEQLELMKENEKPSEQLIVSQDVAEYHVGLKKAYIRSITTSVSANVVLQISRENSKKIFMRGTDTGVIWWEKEYEYKDSFNKALEMAIDQIPSKLQDSCD